MDEGDRVKVIQPIITGVIVDIKYSKPKKCLAYKIEWDSPDGGKHHRWFFEYELALEGN